MEKDETVRSTRRQKPRDLDPFDGTDLCWAEFHKKFCVVAGYNQWDYEEQGAHLALCLEGEPFRVWNKLPSPANQDLKMVVKTLNEHYCTSHNKDLAAARFRARSRRDGEKLDDYSYDLRKILSEKYPEEQPCDLETVLVERFIEGLGDKEQERHLWLMRPDLGTLEAAVHCAYRYQLSAERTGLGKTPHVAVAAYTGGQNRGGKPTPDGDRLNKSKPQGSGAGGAQGKPNGGGPARGAGWKPAGEGQGKSEGLPKKTDPQQGKKKGRVVYEYACLNCMRWGHNHLECTLSHEEGKRMRLGPGKGRKKIPPNSAPKEGGAR